MKRLILAAPLLLVACVDDPPRATDTACLWVAPIYVSRQDVLTDGTAVAILSHNEKWKANCPPG